MSSSRKQATSAIIIFVFLSILFIQPLTAQTNEDAGQWLGTAIGAIIGSQFGDGKGKIVGTVAGALVGNLIGGEIGRALDEEDQERLAVTTRRTLETGRPQSFSNPKSGVKGRVKVVEVVRTTTTNSASRQESRCREVEQEITLKDGRSIKEVVRACRGENGWEMQ